MLSLIFIVLLLAIALFDIKPTGAHSDARHQDEVNGARVQTAPSIQVSDLDTSDRKSSIASMQGLAVPTSTTVEGTNVQQASWPSPFESVGLGVGTTISRTYGLVSADLDDDGDMDLVSSDYGGRIVAWENDGTPFDGGWMSHQISTTWPVISLAAADLDGDGDIDLASAQYHGPMIWENDGTPFDGEWPSQQLGNQSVGVIELVDMNGDRRLDLISGVGMPWQRNPSENNWITVWYAPVTPFGGIWSSTNVGLAYYTPLGLAVGDLDEDGDNDIVIGTDHAPPVGDVDHPVPREEWPDVYQIRAFRNNGGNQWAEYNVGRDPEIETLAYVAYHGYWGASVSDVELGDLDQDGDLDIVATERVEGDFLVMGWQNDGSPFSGELWAPSAIAIGEEHYWLHDSVLWAEVGDFDLDGDLDVVSGSRGLLEPLPLKLWENTGIAFGAVISETHWLRRDIPSRRRDMRTGRVADLDGDGDLDLATATHPWANELSEIRVWENADLRIKATPATQQVAPGQATTYDGATTAWHDFDHPVNLWVSGLPRGANATWTPGTLIPPGTSKLRLTLPPGSLPGDYPLLAVTMGGNFVRTAPFAVTVMASGVGEAIPRIRCQTGYIPAVYAQELSSPAGLAFDPSGVLHVAEEGAGRVSRVRPGGSIVKVVDGLTRPHGIAFDPAGNLYVVEDVQGGRLVRVAPNGSKTGIATGRDAPEGVTWTTGGTLYITESNADFISSPPSLRTRVTAVSPQGAVSSVLTDTLYWSYAGIAAAGDGTLYVTNEASGKGTNDSIYALDPATGERTIFSSGLVAPQGLQFEANGRFPLYIVEADTSGRAGRLGQVDADGAHTVLCNGFYGIQDVARDASGQLYVSESQSGWIIAITPPKRLYLPLVSRGR